MSENNRIQLIGNLGGDPDLRYTGSGKAVCDLSMATTDRYRGDNGEAKEATEWHMVRAWGALAERAGQLRKGASVLVIGSVKTEKWTDRNNVERYTTRVIAQRIVLTGALPAQPGYESEGGRR